ncbi:MAG TPA: thioredoxin domain-containing protein [Pyrinomonadaceae bacterium]|jgi:protein-disulfide isomerase
MSKRHPKHKGRKPSAPANAAGRPSWLPPALIAGALVLAVVAGVWFWRSSQAPVSSVAAGSPGASPPWTAGNANAPVTVEEFGDYQCPPCGTVYSELEKIREDYGDRVRLVFRHYPITRLHPNALAAAHAAEAAGLQGKFWEMHGQLYRGQKSWENSADAPARFLAYARALGLDAERFARDVNGEAASRRVVADHERARSLGVDGTPSFFVNGRKLPPDAFRGKDVRAAIDAALGGQP